MIFSSNDEKIYSVTEITKKIKTVLEKTPDFNNVWIRGEISNLTHHSSGHIYFTLKDRGAVLSVVFFKYSNKYLKFKLETGMSVLVFGSITLFEKGGRYQVNVTSVRPEGIGELQKRIDQLKKKLLDEGIFDESRKKNLPFLPKRLGIVTSPTGAAVRDILKVALRRYPNIEVVIAPAKVQGEDAPETIVRAIQELNRKNMSIDVIIAGRGGGSFEDLMPFNEEEVVRAFFNSEVPIISAVGHQIDHPLSDDAADLSAPTPSAAAEIAVPLKQDLKSEIDYLMTRSENALFSGMREFRLRIDSILNRKLFLNPREILNYRQMYLSEVENRFILAMKEKITQIRNRYFLIPDIEFLVNSQLMKKEYKYNLAVSALEKLSPVGVMKRGYSIARDDSGNFIKSINDTETGEHITVQMHDGKIGCVVEQKEKGVDLGKEKNI